MYHLKKVSSTSSFVTYQVFCYWPLCFIQFLSGGSCIWLSPRPQEFASHTKRQSGPNPDQAGFVPKINQCHIHLMWFDYMQWASAFEWWRQKQASESWPWTPIVTFMCLTKGHMIIHWYVPAWDENSLSQDKVRVISVSSNFAQVAYCFQLKLTLQPKKTLTP